VCELTVQSAVTKLIRGKNILVLDGTIHVPWLRDYVMLRLDLLHRFDKSLLI